jgi:hypothetical protein
MKESVVTSPSEAEADAHKKQQEAVDIAYTLNHALSCGATDVVLQPAIAAAFGVNVGCGNPNHYHPNEPLTLKSFAVEAGHYFRGEIIGDVVAVPLTIAVQRNFPDFMHGIRKLLEPATGWAFRLGANRNANEWADKSGVSRDSFEVKARAESIYEHEMSHLPQAVVWNMISYPISAVAQRMGGHNVSYPEIFKNKLLGATVSNSLLLGGRVLAPESAQKWDYLVGDHVFLPASKMIGGLFGVDAQTMEHAARNSHAENEQTATSTWASRVKSTQSVDIKTATITL